MVLARWSKRGIVGQGVAAGRGFECFLLLLLLLLLTIIAMCIALCLASNSPRKRRMTPSRRANLDTTLVYVPKDDSTQRWRGVAGQEPHCGCVGGGWRKFPHHSNTANFMNSVNHIHEIVVDGCAWQSYTHWRHEIE
jgi:hypothetical protein